MDLDSGSFHKILQHYHPSNFVSTLKSVPSHRIKLGNFPTPLDPWTFSWNGTTYNMLIKRDDLSDLTAGGNKLRKLEFILPAVFLGHHDWLLSLGPVQSNSCRVVSAVAPRLGLRSAHVLIKNVHYNEARLADGNLFFHKLFDSKLFFVSKDDYAIKGQEKLLEEARVQLVKEYGATNPYLVPMGGSTVHGLFGYIECFIEIAIQLEARQMRVDHIFFACGSGGTAAGLAIGKFLSKSPFLKNVKLTGYIVWDSTPEHFHQHVNLMLNNVGLGNEVKSEELVRFVVVKGEGYGISTEEELEFIKSVARSSGIALDGTYNSKAVHNFVKEMGLGQDGEQCMFLHTGGLFSMMAGDLLV